ncbi:MAG: CDGSH iron-sulfur domain-containing protein [Bacteroidales bacterium]|nr:CDGSH iron-sulfur domain-containing protein [Bacteroidales bacterium]MCF8389238.1 CDGSH iron-sulfur domain-containing protein [Bacteroidales bacterium]
METKEKTKFTVKIGSALEVSGAFSLRGKDGKIIQTEEKMYLCRCGASNKKPFCDGEHRKIGFNQ